MKIAIAQVNSNPGKFSQTVERMLSSARQALAAQADLVVFPATVMSGAYPQGLVEHRAYQLDLIDALYDLAARTPVACVVPAYMLDSQDAYTEFFLCDAGDVCPLRRREAYTSAIEYDGVSSAPVTLSWGGVDLLFVAGSPSASAQDVPCDVMLAMSPMPFCRDDASSLGVFGLGEGVLSSLIAESPCWMAFVQGVGAYDDVVLAGGSFAADPDGVIVASCPIFEEGISVFDVDDSGDEQPPCAAGQFVGRRVDEIESISDDQWTAYLYRALVVSVRDYVRKSGFSDVVVGLSGGIDSSVVAALAVDALGCEHVRGVLMPGPYSSASSIDDAEALAANLGIKTCTVPIKDMFAVADEGIAQALGGVFEGVGRENLQARLRGCVLMSLSNAWGALVLNTGNKSESGMGYSTLYGDTVGAYAPLADVYKGRVYELARWRNACSPFEVIPENVLVKPPSAELSENQTDEGSFGATYEQIDQVLTMHVDRGLDACDAVQAGMPADVVDKVLTTCANAEYKRRQEPMGPVVTMRCFADRGWPVVNGWRDHASERDADEPGLDRWCDFGDVDCDDLEARPDVDEALDAMLQTGAVRSNQLPTAVADVTFSALASGQAGEMDDCFGFPMFSKN